MSIYQCGNVSSIFFINFFSEIFKMNQRGLDPRKCLDCPTYCFGQKDQNFGFFKIQLPIQAVFSFNILKV